MGDRDKVACNQAHEMAYICRKFGKSGKKANVKVMQGACKAFKAKNKDKGRANFYKYLKEKKILSKIK